MQSGNEEGGAHQPVWMQGSSWMPPGPGIYHMGELAMPKMDSLDADGHLHAIINDSVHSVDVPLQNPNFQDHEMFSWLHFPVDDAMDKAFCADIFRDFPSSNAQVVKHSFNQLGLQQVASPLHTTDALFNDLLPSNPGFLTHNVCPSFSQGTVEIADSSSSCQIETRLKVAGADAAMSEAGGHTAVVSESYDGVEPVQLPLSAGDHLQATLAITKLKNLDTVPPVHPNPSMMDLSQRHCSSSGQGSATLSALKPTLDVSVCTAEPSLQRNFAHFSSPVAETRASLHALSANSGLTSIERARQPYGQAGKVDYNAMKQPLAKDVVTMDVDTRHGSMQLNPLPPASLSVPAVETSRGKSIGEDNTLSSHLSNAITASNRAMEQLHITEQTATSLSRGSASSSEKSGKEAATALKRRYCGAEDSECQSEDLEETTNNSKKSVKRSRAAVMHNLCERKRRDRINEKLLALRDLMPNSSKTAKASILDEAIEYVKLLQSQLQTWSTRTGICIPPALIPSMDLHHLPVPTLPHMGLGMGVGMGVGLGMGMGMGMGKGMGMGFMDVNTAAVAAGRTMMPLSSYPTQPATLPSHGMNGIQPCLTSMGLVDGQEHLQSPPILNHYNMFVPQHQAQAPMNLTMCRNMELYNAYMQGQQQQQWHLHQQHQWQLLQQQQLQGNNASKPAQ